MSHNPRSQYRLTLSLLRQYLRNMDIRVVRAGQFTSFAVTTSGVMYAWGDNLGGLLGLSELYGAVVLGPVMVMEGLQQINKQVARVWPLYNAVFLLAGRLATPESELQGTDRPPYLIPHTMHYTPYPKQPFPHTTYPHSPYPIPYDIYPIPRTPRIPYPIPHTHVQPLPIPHTTYPHTPYNRSPCLCCESL